MSHMLSGLFPWDHVTVSYNNVDPKHTTYVLHCPQVIRIAGVCMLTNLTLSMICTITAAFQYVMIWPVYNVSQ